MLVKYCQPSTIFGVFLCTSAALLALTALAKLWALADGDSQFMGVLDPLLGLPIGRLLLLAAFIEFGVAVVCLCQPANVGLLAVAWLSTVFLTYRVGLWWIGWKKPCSCLGNLTDALHISPQLADNVMKGLLAFMLIGSVSLLILHYRQGRVAAASPAQPAPEPGQA